MFIKIIKSFFFFLINKVKYEVISIQNLSIAKVIFLPFSFLKIIVPHIIIQMYNLKYYFIII